MRPASRGRAASSSASRMRQRPSAGVTVHSPPAHAAGGLRSAFCHVHARRRRFGRAVLVASGSPSAGWSWKTPARVMVPSTTTPMPSRNICGGTLARAHLHGRAAVLAVVTSNSRLDPAPSGPSELLAHHAAQADGRRRRPSRRARAARSGPSSRRGSRRCRRAVRREGAARDGERADGEPAAVLPDCELWRDSGRSGVTHPLDLLPAAARAFRAIAERAPRPSSQSA